MFSLCRQNLYNDHGDIQIILILGEFASNVEFRRALCEIIIGIKVQVYFLSRGIGTNTIKVFCFVCVRFCLYVCVCVLSCVVEFCLRPVVPIILVAKERSSQNNEKDEYFSFWT